MLPVVLREVHEVYQQEFIHPHRHDGVAVLQSYAETAGEVLLLLYRRRMMDLLLYRRHMVDPHKSGTAPNCAGELSKTRGRGTTMMKRHANKIVSDAQWNHLWQQLRQQQPMGG